MSERSSVERYIGEMEEHLDWARERANYLADVASNELTPEERMEMQSFIHVLCHLSEAYAAAIQALS